eukprot:1157785-Pelagomonas_calceolata.AAC.3
MLERMYTRWAQAMGYSTRTLDRAAGEEAGLKSVELEVTGIFAYGYLKGEKGTHRLVRSSPFNAKGLRQTSFAGVEVMPLLGDMQVNIDIKESDLQMSFQRAGGAGGQNVNKVETGVRITHVPTGLSVKCTQERTQAANRQIAMDMLKAKLLVVLEEQQAQKLAASALWVPGFLLLFPSCHKAKGKYQGHYQWYPYMHKLQVAEIRGDAVKAEWGQQIRNYVFHPYKLVKDTRTVPSYHPMMSTAAVLCTHLDLYHVKRLISSNPSGPKILERHAADGQRTLLDKAAPGADARGGMARPGISCSGA